MKVLITGGGGFLGSYIVKELLKREFEVRNLSRGDYPELKQLGVECFKGSISNQSDVERALEGVDAVIHTAAKAGVWGKKEEFYQTNVEGTQHIIKGMKKAGIDVLVYTSSPSVVFGKESLSGVDESTPIPDKHYCTYAETKALAEKLVIKACEQNEVRGCCLRPHLIWGPGDPHIYPRLVRMARLGKLKRIGDGENQVDVIYVENAAKAHVDALEKLISNQMPSGQCYFLGQDSPVKLWEFINQMISIEGLGPVKKSVPLGVAYTLGAVSEKVYQWLGIYDKDPIMTRFVALQMGTDHYYDHSKAKKDFGYRPEVSVSQGLERLSQASDR